MRSRGAARRPTLACVLATVLSAAAWAHDFWVEPSAFRPKAGETVAVPLRVGVEYVGDPVPRDDLRTQTFSVFGPDGETKVAGEDRKDPAGRFTPAKDGTYVVAFRSKRRSIELEAAKFEAYLREEGLDDIVKARAARGDSDKRGREVYSRCAKSILRVGDAARGGHDRVCGLTLEVVPETDPYAVRAGADLTFRVLHEGKPFGGGLLVARCRADPKRIVSVRTSDDGRGTLRLAHAGEWMVKCVRMTPAPAETGMDWESLWATVTFELSPPAPAAGK